MTDLKKEKIETQQLALGMFVTELDRPWIDSPFMLQGFVLEDQADIDTMVSICKYVYVDRTRSIGDQLTETPKHDVSIKRNTSVMRIKDPNSQPTNKNTPTMNKARRGEKVSFMDVLREVKNYQSPQNTENNNEEGVAFNVRHGADSALQSALPYEEKSEAAHPPSTKNIISDIGSFIGGLFDKKKSKLSTKTSAQQSNSNQVEATDHENDENLIIYEQESPVEHEIAVIYPTYEQSQIITRDIFDAIATDQQFDISGVSESLDSMVESIGRTPDALLWLAKLKKTDGYAYNQALNVSITLMAFGSFLAFSKEQIKTLGLAGLLQDIGKVKLSSDILLKEGKLTREEYDHAKKHVEESLKILQTTPNIPSEVFKLVAEHHERIDGSGYPSQLNEDQLSVPSQAAGLIDTYCAMTNHRSYAKGSYHQQALDEIQALSDKQFTSVLIDQLVQFMGIYPVSSLVAVNTGEVGVIIQQNQVRRLLPRLMLLLGPDKVRYNAPVVLDLINKPLAPNGELYRIVKSLAPDSYDLNPSDFYI